MKLPDNIYIIGGFGSGKSSLAKKISKIKNIPYFDLDDIRWVKKYSHKLSDSERKDKLVDILAGYQKRIIEGCVIDWADICYTSADLVVLLKIPGYLAAWRILKRYISRLLYGKHTGTFFGTLSYVSSVYVLSETERKIFFG